jgi:hypothetical protein
MTMPPGYTPPPQVDPTTGLPFTQQPPPPASTIPGQQPITINVNDPAQQPPIDPEAPISRAQMEEILNAERERVRKEEKDKLYPQIAELGETVKTLKEAEEAREADRIAAEQHAAEEERLRQEAEMSAVERVQQIESTWETRFQQMQQERDAERAMLDKERQLGQLTTYTAQRIAEEAGDIAPQFRDYIRGNSPEEIEQSITMAKQKTAEIVNEFQQAGLNNRRQLAPPISGSPPVDPAAVTGEQQTMELTAAQIRDMSMDEYQQYRAQLLQAGSQRVRDQGVYAP